MARSLVALGAAGFVLCCGVAPCPAADTGAITPENASRVVEIATLVGHKAPVFSIAFSPDGTKVASAGIDKTVRVWDVATQKQEVEFKGHTRQAISVAFSPDGANVISAGYDGAIRVFDAKTGKSIDSITKSAKGEPVAVETVFQAFSPDASRFATSFDGGTHVDLWDLKARSLRQIESRSSAVREQLLKPAFSGDGAHLAIQHAKGEESSSVEVWNVAAGKWEASIPAPEKANVANEGIAMDATGATVAVVDIHSSKILLFDVKSGKAGAVLSGHVHDANSEQIMISGLAFSPDGKVLASASYDKTVRLWDTASGKQLASLPSHKDGAGAVAFSRDGARIASADLDGTVQVFGLPAK